ncbi:MAG TPA: substrate-binding domain-containing protein [Thermoanaerobaculia bacterium]|nr:substrate-binding domain-containing protein [Thermoanaerobaculia bacterium]
MLCVLAFLLLAGVPAGEAPFRVVVHRANPVSSLTRAELSAIYLKRMRTWPASRADIVPIEQPATSRVREQFSRAIHGKSVAYVTRYWHRLIFAGRGVPPVEARSSAAVLELVKKQRGAIGYIDAQTPPGDGVKVIAVAP